MADFPKKYYKVLKGTDFLDSSESKSNDELKQQVLRSQDIIVGLEVDLANDVKISSLKEDLKHLTGAFKDEINLEKAKSAYCLHLLKERGQGIG
jgi:hypothetical protein